MKTAIFLVLFSAGLCLAATARAPNAAVRYDGIDEKQANAIAQTISAARKVYVDDFGFDMPETIIATITAKIGQPTRLYNDGMDRLNLSIPSAAMLDRPQKSGVLISMVFVTSWGIWRCIGC